MNATNKKENEKESEMTYEAAEKKAFEDTMNNDAITPDRAVAEYWITILGYGWKVTDDGPVAVKNHGYQWGN